MILKTRPRVEALPERPRGVAAPRPPLPLGAPARAVAVLAELRAADRAPRPSAFFAAIDTEPIPHADWSAWLADDWDHLADRYAVLDDAVAREFAAFRAAFEYAPYVLVAPLLAELTELTTVQLPDWRQALTAAAEDELAWIDAEMAVSL